MWFIETIALQESRVFFYELDVYYWKTAKCTCALLLYYSKSAFTKIIQLSFAFRRQLLHCFCLLMCMCQFMLHM